MKRTCPSLAKKKTPTRNNAPVLHIGTRSRHAGPRFLMRRSGPLFHAVATYSRRA